MRKASKKEEDSRGECDGARPLIDKNWWGDLIMMMKKIQNKPTANDGG